LLKPVDAMQGLFCTNVQVPTFSRDAPVSYKGCFANGSTGYPTM